MLTVVKTHVSATMSLEYVPETQMATSIPLANDARMKDDNADSGVQNPLVQRQTAELRFHDS